MKPKVKFKIPKIDSIIESLDYFLNPPRGEESWKFGILREYPDLEKELSGVKDREKRILIGHEFFYRLQKEKEKVLRSTKRKFQDSWNAINDSVMNVLSVVVEKDWEPRDKIITARICLNPICPRYLDERTFDMYYKCKTRRMKEIAIHELLHFIWFEKWEQVFPKTPKRHFDHPYLEWELSEVVPKIILSDGRVQNVFKHDPVGYIEHANKRIGKKPIYAHIEEIYNRRKDFGDFVENSWIFFQRYRKEIERSGLK